MDVYQSKMMTSAFYYGCKVCKQETALVTASVDDPQIRRNQRPKKNDHDTLLKANLWQPILLSGLDS